MEGPFTPKKSGVGNVSPVRTKRSVKRFACKTNLQVKEDPSHPLLIRCLVDDITLSSCKDALTMADGQPWPQRICGHFEENLKTTTITTTTITTTKLRYRPYGLNFFKVHEHVNLIN